jgi:hypothetical protein
MKHLLAAAAATITLAASSAALAQLTVPPSKWGPNDEIGAANYLTPAVALEAARLVKTGKSYSLGITVNTTTPAYPPRNCQIYIVQPGQAGSAAGLGPTKTTYNDDILNCWVGIGSQLDGLGHIGVGDTYYNGNKWNEIGQMGGLKKLGTHKVPPMVTRGVLLDMAAYYGVDVVKEGTAFNTKEIERPRAKSGRDDPSGRRRAVPHRLAEPDRQGSEALRVGRARPGPRRCAIPGVQGRGGGRRRHLGLEPIPFEQGAGVFEVHQILLPMNGTYILENMNTAELAKDKVPTSSVDVRCWARVRTSTRAHACSR